MSDTEATTGTEIAVEAEPSLDEIAAKLFGSADATAEGAGAAVPVVVPAVPVAEKVAARIAVAQRAELRAAKSRQEQAAEKAEIATQRAELAEHVKVAEALKAAKTSPSKALELLGYKHPKEFLESLATEYEPDAVARRAVEGTHSELEKLQARVDAFEKAEKDRGDRARRSQDDERYNEATREFIAHVEAAPEKYPHLHAEHTLQEIAQMAQRAADQHAVAYHTKFGDYPDDEVIANHLEDQAKARAEALAERRARIGKPASVPSQGKPSGVLQATQPDPGLSPRTLTSRAASERASAEKPWSQEAADEESIRILNAAFKTG